MRLKGTMVLELTDGATGEVETVTEENMVTEAVNDILGMNPMGVFYSEERLADVMSWNGTMLPVCPNMIGGILLFPKALEEDAGHIYELSDNLPVAYASNNVNSTANTARGSLNLTESKALENGYKFVWEFTPSQGNGTIAAIALTSAKGGENGYGSLVGDASAFLQLKVADIGDVPKAKQMVLFETVEVDFENNLLYSITAEDSSVRIRKIRIPIFNIGLNEKLDAFPYMLSGGQQQCTAIARAFITKPSVILADEPTGNLDGKTSQNVARMLKMISLSLHQTLVIITHKLELAQLADDVIQIRDGRIINKN